MNGKELLQCLYYFVQEIAKILDQLHDNGITHRDVRVPNI